MSLTKNPKPKTKKIYIFFFTADSKTCQVISGFEQLSSALGAIDIHVQRHVQIAGFLAETAWKLRCYCPKKKFPGGTSLTTTQVQLCVNPMRLKLIYTCTLCPAFWSTRWSSEQSRNLLRFIWPWRFESYVDFCCWVGSYFFSVVDRNVYETIEKKIVISVRMSENMC